MKKDSCSPTEEELLQGIARFLNAPPDEEEIDDILREEGYDPDELAERFRALAKEALANSPYNWRNRGTELEEARRRLRADEDSLPSDRCGLIERIRELVKSLGPRAQALSVQYRDLENVTDTDLRSLLADLQHLENEDKL